MYTTRAAPGRGLGVFADKDIKAGTRIMTDEPLVSMEDGTLSEGFEERITAALESLSPEQLQEFETLHCPPHPFWTPHVSRYLANGFELEPGTSGIFLKAARFNHSCCANAIFAWNGNLQRVTVHAMVDIPAGEEISVSYDFPFGSVTNRRKRLHEIYGFVCDCPACHLEDQKNEGDKSARQRLEDLYEAVDALARRHGNAVAEEELHLIIEFIKLAEDENLNGQFLSGFYERASVYYEARGTLGLALEYAEVELEMETRLLGQDHPMTMQTTEAMDALKSKIVMKELENLDVGGSMES